MHKPASPVRHWLLLACLGGCGFERHETPPVPRLISPLSSARVNTEDVTLRFALPPTLGSPAVDISSRRDFTGTVLHGNVSAEGGRALPDSPLTTGLWYWRVRAASPMGPSVSPTWQFRVLGQLSMTEASWGSQLDANGDGYDELAVGAPNAAVFTNGMADGKVFVYPGTPDGPDPSHPLQLEAPVEGGRFGFALAAVDFNGDGYVDLAVGAPSALVPGGAEGAVFVYYGSASGVHATPDLTLTVEAGGDFGWAVDSAGDFNGDGYGDLVVGAPTTRTITHLSGRAYIFNGASDGYGLVMPIEPETSGLLQVGASVTGGGDLDGDGLDDVIVGAPGAQPGGHAWIIHGGLLGAEPTLLDPSAPQNAQFGYSAVVRGDLDGDGIADLAVGAPAIGAGRVYFYLGQRDAPPLYAGLLDGTDEPGAHFGSSLASGDLDGDGIAELAISAPCGAAGSCPGKVYLSMGGAMWTGPDTSSFGTGLSMGDLDGDGLADLSVGGANFGNSLGRVDWFRNAAAGATLILNGSDPSARFGYVVR